MKAFRMLKILFAAGSLFLMLCMRGGTDTGNARVVGVVYNQDGSRAVNAEISFVPSEFSPANGPCLKNKTTTNDTGGYQFDSLPSATYNVLGAGSNGLSFEDSVDIGISRVIVPPCTLKASCNLSGIVEVEPGDNPAVALVVMLGTNTLGVTDSNGKFEIDNLAAGRYIIRIIPIDPKISMMDMTIEIVPGANLQITNPIKLRSSGIPTVSGLTAIYDTLHQSVSLSWKGIHDSLIQGYELWRKNADLNLSLQQTPARLLKDTFYRDTTCTPAGDGVTFEYRVLAKDSNDNPGLFGDGVKVRAVPRYYVSTTMQLDLSGNFSQLDSTNAPPFDLKPFTMLNDSVSVVASYYNPTRLVKKVEWFNDAEDTPRKTAYKSDSAGTDTIRMSWPTEAIHCIKFKVTDNGGTIWNDSLLIESLSSFFPTIWAGPDTIVPRHATLQLLGTTGPSPSRVVKWEWNIGNSGFAATSRGDTTITVPDSAISAYPCILRVTNDHHFTTMDTVVITVGL